MGNTILSLLSGAVGAAIVGGVFSLITHRLNRKDKLADQEAEKIEKEIEEIDALMNGEAATDYTRLSELDERKNALEERLLEIYGEI